MEPALGVRTCAETGVIVVTPSLPETLAADEREAVLKSLARRLPRRRAGAVRALVLHADDAALLAPHRSRLHRLRLHGRARQFPLRAGRAARPRARAARRRPTSSSPAATACTRPRRTVTPTSTPSRPASTAPISARPGRSTRSPTTRRSLPRPRFGFYGVIDERMDLELVAAVADAHPEWSIVMVGPVVKIDPADLPQRRQHPLSRRQEL